MPLIRSTLLDGAISCYFIKAVIELVNGKRRDR